MSPFDYLRRYHEMNVTDTDLDIDAVLDIRRYINGWTTANNVEYWKLLDKICKNLKLKGPSLVPRRFYITDKKLEPDEVFYRESIRRTYEGRGSPEDMADTLRLAVWAGLTKPENAAQYARDWFGQDCNSFAGNYLGISPSTSIAAYARGYGTQPNLPGATIDVYETRNLVPLRPEVEFTGIGLGDVLCTFGTADKNGNRWRHIAVVESWTADGEPKDDKVTGTISLAEWGQAGGPEKHKSEGRHVTLQRGKLCPELAGSTVIAFKGTDPGGGEAWRIFFDTSTLMNLESRGWRVGNTEGV